MIFVEEIGDAFVNAPVVVGQGHEPLMMLRNRVGDILSAGEVGLQRL